MKVKTWFQNRRMKHKKMNKFAGSCGLPNSVDGLLSSDGRLTVARGGNSDSSASTRGEKRESLSLADEEEEEENEDGTEQEEEEEEEEEGEEGERRGENIKKNEEDLKEVEHIEEICLVDERESGEKRRKRGRDGGVQEQIDDSKEGAIELEANGHLEIGFGRQLHVNSLKFRQDEDKLGPERIRAHVGLIPTIKEGTAVGNIKSCQLRPSDRVSTSPPARNVESAVSVLLNKPPVQPIAQTASMSLVYGVYSSRCGDDVVRSNRGPTISPTFTVGLNKASADGPVRRNSDSVNCPTSSRQSVAAGVGFNETRTTDEPNAASAGVVRSSATDLLYGQCEAARIRQIVSTKTMNTKRRRHDAETSENCPTPQPQSSASPPRPPPPPPELAWQLAVAAGLVASSPNVSLAAPLAGQSTFGHLSSADHFHSAHLHRPRLPPPQQPPKASTPEPQTGPATRPSHLSAPEYMGPSDAGLSGRCISNCKMIGNQLESGSEGQKLTDRMQSPPTSSTGSQLYPKGLPFSLGSMVN